MKRLGLSVILSIMLFAVFGGFINPEKSYALTCGAGESVQTINGKEQCAKAPDLSAEEDGPQVAPSTFEAENKGSAAVDDPNNPANAGKTTSLGNPITPTPGSCSLVSGNLVSCVDSIIAWFITHTLLAFAGWFLWLTASLMNYSINIAILGFANWAPPTLYPVWLIIRQIVSLIVVFAGLWLGFMYIIGDEKKFEKYIPWLVMFALFVNFSYPLTRMAVDVSNIVSLNIYTGIVGDEALSSDVMSSKTPGAIIRSKLGLEGLVDFATDGNTGVTSETSKTGALNKINSTPAALLAVIYIVYAAYIFFKVTAILVMRTAALVFLIVASPLLFVDSVIPRLGDEAAKLRKVFVEQLAVGPIFMIMLGLTLSFLDVFSASGALNMSGGVSSSINQGGGAAIGMFFNILMMLIMLHIMFKVTEAVSGKIGQMASDAMGKVGGFAGGIALGVATGGAGLLGRATIGRGAAALGQHSWITSQAAKSGVGGFVGRGILGMTNSVANSSFDARNSSIAKAGAGKLGLGVGMGSTLGMLGSKGGGREERIEKVNKEREDIARGLGLHKKNVYSEDGVLLHKKGDRDTSEKANAQRMAFQEAAGTSWFGNVVNVTDKAKEGAQLAERDTKFAVQDVYKSKAVEDLQKMPNKTAKDQENIQAYIASFKNTLSNSGEQAKLTKELNDANESRAISVLKGMKNETADDKKEIEKYMASFAAIPSILGKLEDTYKNKQISDYNNIDTSTDAGKQKKVEYLSRVTDVEVREKLKESDIKKIVSEYRSFDDTETGIAEKRKLFDKQDPETQKRIIEYDKVSAVDTEDKKESRNTERKYREETLAVSNRLATAQEELLKATLAAQGKNAGPTPGDIPPDPSSPTPPRPVTPRPPAGGASPIDTTGSTSSGAGNTRTQTLNIPTAAATASAGTENSDNDEAPEVHGLDGDDWFK